MKEKGKRVKNQKFKGLFLEFQTTDVVTGEEYLVSIDSVFVAFPGLKKMGQRLEVFYKKKGVEWGEVYEIGTVIISDGKFKIINW